MYSATQAHLKIQLLFAPESRTQLFDLYRSGGVRAVHLAFQKITTSAAIATNQSDAAAINEIVSQLPQGFYTLDCILQQTLSALLIMALARDEDNNTAQCMDGAVALQKDSDCGCGWLIAQHQKDLDAANEARQQQQQEIEKLHMEIDKIQREKQGLESKVQQLTKVAARALGA